jgi:hypothetical protein
MTVGTQKMSRGRRQSAVVLMKLIRGTDQLCFFIYEINTYHWSQRVGINGARLISACALSEHAELGPCSLSRIFLGHVLRTHSCLELKKIWTPLM